RSADHGEGRERGEAEKQRDRESRHLTILSSAPPGKPLGNACRTTREWKTGSLGLAVCSLFVPACQARTILCSQHGRKRGWIFAGRAAKRPSADLPRSRPGRGESGKFTWKALSHR